MRGGVLKELVDPEKGIREDLEEGYFEFYVKGYTQGGRQQAHQLIYNDAAFFHGDYSKPVDEIMFPFRRDYNLHSINLVPEPTNKWDKHAIRVVAKYPTSIAKFITEDDNTMYEMELGYVPKSISRIITHNLPRLQAGWVKRVRRIHDKKHFVTKVAIPFNYLIIRRNKHHFKRALSIIE